MPAEYGSVTPRAAAVATAASTALPPSRSTSIPAAVASASTLATAPPYPTATGDLGGGTADGDEEVGAAAPTVTTAASTLKNDTFRATERRMRTSSEGSSAQGNAASPVSSGPP